MKIYLITSDSYKLINSEVDKIIQDSLNVIKYDLRVDSLTDVINEANYFSLTNEHKYIIVKSANLFKGSKKEENEKEESLNNDIKLLEKYITNPSEISTIIFTSLESPDKRRKVYKQLAEKGNIIEIPAFNKKDLTYKCMELLKKKGYTANYDVANYIVENSYVNYDIMISEINKINILCKKGNIGISDIKNVISKSISVSVRNFINSLVNRDIQKSIKYSEYFETLKIEPIVILITLANELEIYYLLKLGVNPKEIQIKYQKEDWKMREYLMNVDNYTLKEIKKIITNLNDYDYRLKSGLLDRELLVDLLILEFCE